MVTFQQVQNISLQYCKTYEVVEQEFQWKLQLLENHSQCTRKNTHERKGQYKLWKMV